MVPWLAVPFFAVSTAIADLYVGLGMFLHPILDVFRISAFQVWRE
jgi:hypothetical protein